MPSFAFAVEFVDPQGRYVLARQLAPGAGFRLGPGSRLGECEVAGVAQPRAVAADGAPRLDIYGFRLKDPACAAQLRVGQVVELRADVAALPHPTDETEDTVDWPKAR